MSLQYPLPKGIRQVVPDYVADGATTVAFAIPFRFFDPTDIWVGHQPTGSTAAFVQNVLGTDYQISGAGLEAGGTVTFFSPPPAGLVRIMGLRTPSRLTSTVNDGAIISSALEAELDVQEMTLQELRRDVSSALAALGSVFFIPTLGPPALGSGVDGGMAWDATNEVMYGPREGGVWPAGVSLQGPPGSGTFHFWSTSGAPSAGLGSNGDMAVDPVAFVLYGPKAAGAWPAGVSLGAPFPIAASIAALRAMSTSRLTATQLVWVTEGGNNGGLFQVATSSPGADDGELIIASNTSGFWYQRVTLNARGARLDGRINFAQIAGADPTGATNNDAALAKAFSLLPAAGGTIYFPSGKYKFSAQQALTFPNALFSLVIEGDGQDATILYWPAGPGGILCSLNSYLNSVHFRDLTFSTGVAAGGFAVSMVQSAVNASSSRYAQNDFFRVTFRGDDGGNATDYWSAGVNINSMWAVNFDTCLFWGSSAELGAGILLQGAGATQYCALINIDKCIFEYTSVGLVYGAYTQGVNLGLCNFNTGAIGIQVGAGLAGTLSQLLVSDCQFNTSSTQIAISTAVFNCQFVNNNFFVGNGQLGINMALPVPFLFDNNFFDGLGGTTNEAIVVGASAIYGGKITSNQFYEIGTGVNLQASSTRITVDDNQFLQGVTTPVVNNGSLNVITDNLGYNPVGASAVSAPASGVDFVNGASPATIFLSSSGAINGLAINHVSILTAALGANVVLSVPLGPNDTLTAVYTGTLTMNKMVH